MDDALDTRQVGGQGGAYVHDRIIPQMPVATSVSKPPGREASNCVCPRRLDGLGTWMDALGEVL
jgi:hypothetical protein